MFLCGEYARGIRECKGRAEVGTNSFFVPSFNRARLASLDVQSLRSARGESQGEGGCRLTPSPNVSWSDGFRTAKLVKETLLFEGTSWKYQAYAPDGSARFGRISKRNGDT